MRKFIALLLVLALMVSVAPAVFASTTTLTTTIPEATYTFSIPADQQIPFGSTKSVIGRVAVTESSGFAVGKNLKVTITYDAFSSETVETTIPYDLHFASVYSEGAVTNVPSGGCIYFYGQSSGEALNTANYGDAYITMNSRDWGQAIGGEYTSTITFTAEVVQETD